jgi:hypothetical protein
MPSKRSPKKTPARAANKAASKAAKATSRARTPSRKAAAAAASDDGKEEEAVLAAIDGGDDEKQELTAAEIKAASAHGDDAAAAAASDAHKTAVDDDGRQKAVDDEEKDSAWMRSGSGRVDDDAQAAVAQLTALLGRLPSSFLASAAKEKAGSVAGSDFSDVSESDGEGTRSVLPPRAVADAGPSKRLRGGKDRLPSRQSGIRRAHTADLSDNEIERVDRALKTGAKVPSFSRARARGHRFGRPSSMVMDVLVDEGELPPSGDADRTMASMFETFRAKSAKDARKEVKKYATFAAWFDRYSEMGFLSKERLQEDPDTYWCFD